MEFTSFDGKRIHVREWLEVEKPKGIVQIVHGMAEHSGRYEPFAAYLNANGYMAFADDHRGHGETDERMPGYCAGDMFADTVMDEGTLTAYYRGRYPSIPFFIFGFSYGSFITQSYIGRYGNRLDGAVIAGSSKKKNAEVYLGSAMVGLRNALGGDMKPAKLIEKLSFGVYAKRFPDGEWISNDAENNRRYHEDPLCGFVCSSRFYADFFRGLRRLYTDEYKKSLPKDLPLLLVAGREDPVGDMGKGMEKLLSYYRDEAGMSDVDLTLFEDCRHEFVGVEAHRQERFEVILSFFDRIAQQHLLS